MALNVFGLFAVAFISDRSRSAPADRRSARTDVRGGLADLQLFSQYVIDNLMSGLATADKQNRLLTFNRSGALITGHAQADVIGKPTGDSAAGAVLCNGRSQEDARAARGGLSVSPGFAKGGSSSSAPHVQQCRWPNGARGYSTPSRTSPSCGGWNGRRRSRTGWWLWARWPPASARNWVSACLDLRLDADPAAGVAAFPRPGAADGHRPPRIGAARIDPSLSRCTRPQRFEMQQLDLRRVVQDSPTLLPTTPRPGDSPRG